MEFVNARYLQGLHIDLVISVSAVFGRDIDALLDSAWYNHVRFYSREYRWKKLTY